ncbi:MAG: acyltransferase family protein [Desulfobacca sp.]|uniref:acyltransferase family protein n=1 Tax=Desulfobacca sp. TaxID=2067990 RepID=UPI00404B4BE7
MASPHPARLPWLDTLKAIGVILVIAGHTVGLPPLVLQVIFACHIPLFFWISGIVGTSKVTTMPLTAFILDRSRRRLIPYVLFALLSYLLWVLFLRHVGTRQAAQVPPLIPLLGILYGSDVHDFLAPNVVLWFFPCLFVTELYFSVLARIRSHLLLGLALVPCAILGFLAPIFLPWRLPWGIDLACTTLVFYGAGYLTRDALPRLSLRDPWWGVGLVVSLAIYVALSLYNQPVAIIIGNYGDSFFAFYGAAAAGIVFWSIVAQRLQSSRLLQMIGQHTLVLFALHLLVFPGLTGFCRYVLGLPADFREQSIFFPLLYTVFAIAVLLPVSVWLNRYFPLVVGKNRAKPPEELILAKNGV